MMYSTIIFLWTSLALVIFTRTVAFPADTSKIDISKILNLQPGQTSYTKTVRLHSANSNGFVRVRGNHVDSLGLQSDESAKLQLESTLLDGFVVLRIRSVKENSYLCVSTDGNLTVEVHGNTMSRCLFAEKMESGGYTAFESKYNTNWHLGFKRSGRVKQPHNTTNTQKAARFIVYT